MKNADVKIFVINKLIELNIAIKSTVFKKYDSQIICAITRNDDQNLWIYYCDL